MSEKARCGGSRRIPASTEYGPTVPGFVTCPGCPDCDPLQEACPTCGSDDPAIDLYPPRKPSEPVKRAEIHPSWRCPDPFHSAPQVAPEQEGEARCRMEDGTCEMTESALKDAYDFIDHIDKYGRFLAWLNKTDRERPDEGSRIVEKGKTHE